MKTTLTFFICYFPISLFDLSLSNPYIKVLLPSVAILAVLLLSKYRFNLSFKHDLFLQWPALQQLVFWLAASIIWMLATNYLIDWRGPWNFKPWEQQALYISVLRVLGVGVLGPIAEELVFRAYLFYRVNHLNLFNKWVSVVLIAAVWAAFHFDYNLQVIAVIFVEGILLGAAIIKSKSLVTPILMHISWNLYAIW